MRKFCRVCGTEIDPRRLAILPNATTCTSHSGAGRIAGHPIISGKNTYSELQLVSQEKAQAFYNAGRRTGSIVSSGMRKASKPLGK